MNILLTGSSKGIGAGIKKVLTEAGHTVVGISRSSKAGEDVVSDLSKKQDFSKLYKIAVSKLSQGEHFDVLINNAGICDELDIENSNLEQWESFWRETFEVNLFSSVGLTREFVKESLATSRSTRVINICSRVAFKGQADSPQYAASKAALLNFTRSMAARYASRNVAFFSVSPCWVATDMARGTVEEMSKDIPAKTIAQVEDITPAVTFLIENATMFMTGMNLDINGASYFH